VPIEVLLRLTMPGHTIRPAPPITKRTLELGSKYSPEFVCVPFKYNLGNFIEALENGATVLIQAGGGCRFGYYGEIQELILRDMGYNFTFLRLLGAELRPVRLYRSFRKIGARVSFASFLRALLLAVRMVHVMDGIDEWIRENIGFQRQENAMEELRARFLGELEGVRSFLALERLRRKYRKALGSVEIDRPQNRLKVGVVGELYTLMEPFSNFFLEKELARRARRAGQPQYHGHLPPIPKIPHERPGSAQGGKVLKIRHRRGRHRQRGAREDPCGEGVRRPHPCQALRLHAGGQRHAHAQKHRQRLRHPGPVF